MLKFAWNFTAMFLFVFIGLLAFMGALFGLLWLAIHIGGDYAIPVLLLALISSIWATSYALGERGK